MILSLYTPNIAQLLSPYFVLGPFLPHQPNEIIELDYYYRDEETEMRCRKGK